MEKRGNDGLLILTLMCVSFFFAYMYKWNRMIEDGTIITQPRPQRIIYLFTHSAVSALIGILVFYGINTWQPEFELIFKMAIGALGAVLSDFLIKGLGTAINAVSTVADKWVSK